jgi:pilus assembly protein CpaB
MRKRSGTLIILAGVAIALVAGLMVLSFTRQAAAQATAQVRQVYVVMAARDIAEGTAVSAEALSIQAFPADFVPEGAIPAPEQAVGKFTVTRITKGQIILSNQLSATKRSGALALSVPVGKVAVALPMSDLMSTNGAVKAGDRVDILLTIDLVVLRQQDPSAPAVPVSGGDTKNPVTQATLRNVEVLSVGVADTTGQAAGATNGQRSTPALIVLVDHQEALIIKYAKDSGGIVDLALRAPDDNTPVKTDPVTIDYLFERFDFRAPGLIP